ncbi:MAG TPA: hypothetical protein VFF65_13615, partial [Phycisphaerales bacterium]|nr:hypothetical protein [Phycisphaerales bacterium]
KTITATDSPPVADPAPEPQAKAAPQVATAAVRAPEPPPPAAPAASSPAQPKAQPPTPPQEAPSAVPCASAGLSTAEVWGAVLDAAADRLSLHTMLSGLHLVSLNPDRAVVGHAPRDKFTAEMALGHLGPLFEKVLGRRVAVSLLQVKDAPAPLPPRPTPEPRPAGSGPTPPPPREPQAHTTRPEPAAPSPRASDPAAAPRSAPAAVDVEAAKANPLVQRAAELLGAKVVRITARTDSAPPQQP